MSFDDLTLCNHCKTLKPLEEFHRSQRGASYKCKHCCKRKKSVEEDFQERLTKYGITSAQYYDMLYSHGGCCHICGNKMEKPNIDHCHKTGVVRGLLCINCNLGLGNFKDNPKYMLAAIKYLSDVVESDEK